MGEKVGGIPFQFTFLKWEIPMQKYPQMNVKIALN
jgi:hypothetical protein